MPSYYLSVKRMKIRTVFLLFAILFSSHLLSAQQQFADWINYEQVYYKIAVKADGLYRITYQNLLNAGFPVASVNPRNLQLFFRGEEMAILVSGEEDGIFNETDFIEFIGFRNTGFTDSFMYGRPEWQTNPFVSIYTDQTFYFLTFSLDNTPGKRIQVLNPLSANPALEPYHIQEEVQHYNRAFTSGALFPRFIQSITDQGALLSDFNNQGKGFIDRAVGGTTKLDYVFSIRDYLNNGVRPTLELRMAGRSNTVHMVEILVGTSTANQRVVSELFFNFYETATLQTELEVNDLPATGQFFVSFRVVQLTTTVNEICALSYIKLTYPQRLNAEDLARKNFFLPASATAQTQVEITNVRQGSRWFDMSRLDAIREFRGNLTAGNVFRTSFAKGNQPINLQMETQVRTVDTVGLAVFYPIEYSQKNYLIVTHPVLMRPAGGFNDAVQAYADYRASAAGGGYRPLIADVENLYNHYTWGEPTPLAIRRFMEMAVQRTNPQYLFLLGKGMAYFWFYEYNKPASHQWAFKNYVPCYGEPCSDNVYTSNLNGNGVVPAIPTGRVSAMNAQQVIDYLNKVIEHEQFQHDALWKKKVLHLGGGKTQQENQQLRNHLRRMENVIEGPFYGGEVSTFTKRTTNEVEFIDVANEVNEGLGVMTFFGHSSLTATDFTIGFVSNPAFRFNNRGKYPFMMMLGCDAGHAYARSRSFGEDWTLTPNLGAVTYLAHSHLGFTQPLADFANSVYEGAFSDSTLINRPFGIALQESMRRYMQPRPNNEMAMANIHQMTLSGDPAVRVFDTNKADYHIEDNQLFVRNFDRISPLTVDTDSFQLGVIIKNFGIVNLDTFAITVKRTFNDGTVKEFRPVFIPHISFMDTVYITITTTAAERVISGGNTQLEVFVDAYDDIPELNEQNNMATLSMFLPRTSLTLISPREFSIVNQQPVRFFAQSTNPAEIERLYTFQIDTSANFNSPAFRDTVLTASLTPTWETRLLTDAVGDSMVYYWRARYADAGEEIAWSQSSFIYLKDSPEGWSQSTIPQYKRNGIQNLELDPTTRAWSFTDRDVVIKARTVGNNNTSRFNYQITYDDQVAVLSNCGINHMIFMAFDQITGLPYLSANLPATFCGFAQPGIAIFAPNDRVNFGRYNLIVDGVKDGDYVLVLSAGLVTYQSFNAFGLTGLAQIGIDTAEMRQLRNGEPFMAFGRKGTPVGSAQTVYPRYSALEPPNQQEINGTFSFRLQAVSGNIFTPRIGPSRSWSKLFQQVATQNAEDNYAVQLIGVNQQGQELVLRNLGTEPETDIKGISAEQFPYLRIRASFADSVQKSPPILKRWMVIYEEVPEGILFYDTPRINPGEVLSFAEGDSIRIRYAFRNVSGSDFPNPLVVQYQLQNQQNNQSHTWQDTLPALRAGETANFTMRLSTLERVGRNRLNVYVNPRIQPEQIYENNILEALFQVNRDSINPMLDVVFDGVHIMDGDIVSPSPLITVSLKDENKFLIRKDTVGLELFLNSCDSCQFNRIPFSHPRVSWGNVGGNTFQVNFQPEKLPDGKYTLMVQGADVTGNNSGTIPYKVSFQVINESKVTHVYPYPNPFSDRVRFVFTLTGSEVPDEIKIQIMTVSGRVVREITQDEIGPVRIGNNLTSYAWDGRDEFGDQLANGVYLYRVFMRSQGQDIRRRETAGDRMFKEEFGKMYLMR